MTTTDDGDDAVSAAILRLADTIRVEGESARRAGRDPVNLPLINNWVEAIGDGNPVYIDPAAAQDSVHGGLVAPPAMAQVWTMPGLNPERDPKDPLYRMMAALDEEGFTSVVATNSDQVYHRYLRHGESVAVSTKLESVVGPKNTGLGQGWFVTTRNIWYSGDEAVAEMMFRVLKFRPSEREPESSAQPSTEESGTPLGTSILPAINQDTAYFWEGAAAGELRIQRCGNCGLLRHPPGPMCPECGATKPTYLVACGLGEVYSYVVHHRPAVPGKQLPLVIAVAALDEGVRVLGELHGCAPDDVRIGQRVEVAFQQVDEQVALPYWRPVNEEVSR
ncbi:DNA-binding protein [Allosaccharopolyspora coralli]|uniref:DNA-binding protein n=1 Tax=Allosaccharopolyspora coralli TaxID=2665642 RepID=A0A5Q3Q7P7_9PSEU|nr:OB-fold domain-containing protein [Allosaccharopolyspora coralli]QGK70383.1 DNA-binding protein [Allosaccharopolyspora coralli]